MLNWFGGGDLNCVGGNIQLMFEHLKFDHRSALYSTFWSFACKVSNFYWWKFFRVFGKIKNLTIGLPYTALFEVLPVRFQIFIDGNFSKWMIIFQGVGEKKFQPFWNFPSSKKNYCFRKTNLSWSLMIIWEVNYLKSWIFVVVVVE